MASAVRPILVAALLLSAMGCAVAPRTAPTPPRLMSGMTVAPPAGLLDYCRRTGECAGEGFELRGTLPATGAAGGAQRYTPQPLTSGSSASVFQALLEAQRTVISEAPAVREEVSQARWRELSQLNRTVNRSIRGGTDFDIYGVEERWVRPLAENPGQFAPRGDCEDYALEKRARLIEAGWAPASLALAVAMVPEIGLHAVLIVQTDRGDFVLDNLHDRIRPVSHRDYTWLSRQAGPDLGRWTSARVERVGAVSAPTPPAPPPTLAQPVDDSRQMFQRQLQTALEQARANGARPVKSPRSHDGRSV